VYFPAISPQGDRVAVATMAPMPPEGCRTEDSCTGAVVLIDVGNGESRVVSRRVAQGPLSFSPDGSQLGFMVYDYQLTYRATLIIPTLDGSDETVISGMAAGETPSWSPDGQSVVVGGFAVRRVEIAAAAVTELIPRPPPSDVPPELVLDWGRAPATA